MPGIAENDWPRFGWSGAKLAVIYPPLCNYLTWQQLEAPLCVAPVQVERLAVVPRLSGHRRVCARVFEVKGLRTRRLSF